MNMSLIKDVCIFKKRPRRENITPHRLSVAVLIYEFCKYKETDKFNALGESITRHFTKLYCILILKLIQSPDITLDEFLNMMQNVDHIANDGLVFKVKATLMKISNVGVQCLLDIVDAMGRLPAFEENAVKGGTVHIRNSIVGYFLRRFIIYFDQLSFSEATVILNNFKEYVRRSCLSQIQRGNAKRVIAPDNSWCSTKDQWSRRQAELFVSTQAIMLMHSTRKALTPIELHKQLKNLIESNTDLSEAYFLNYLNCLRVSEFCGALDSLYQCFDKSVVMNAKTNEERSKSYRYAALNLAILNFRFNRKEEGTAALKESIRMAQEANDNVCLQHALSWLCSVTQSNTDKLIEHSILKSLEINLSYIMSLGILSFGQYGGITRGNPKQIFETVTRSDIINCQHGHRDLIAHSFTQKAALWQFYGKVDMSSLWSQLLLNFSTTDRTLIRNTYDEGLCEAVCGIANHAYLQGDYDSANSLFAFVKERFPSEPLSLYWMLSDNIFQFTYHLHHQRFTEAELIAENIASINKWDACLRMGELFLHQQDFSRAHYCVNKVLARYQEAKRVIRIDVQVRARILLIEIQCAICFPDSVPYGILSLLNSTLAFCKDFYLDYYTALVQVHIANVQLMMGMPDEAMNLLSKCIPQFLSNGSTYNRAQSMVLYAKCVVAQSFYVCEDERIRRILRAAKMLDEVKEDFRKLEVHYGVKDVLYLQARLYDEINEVSERNRCAMEYKILDEDCPATNYISLVTFV